MATTMKKIHTPAPKPFDLRETLTKLTQYDHEPPGWGVAVMIAIISSGDRLRPLDL